VIRSLERSGEKIVVMPGDQIKQQEPEEEPDLVDPQDVLRESCSKQKDCAAFQTKLLTCNDRVNSRKQTAETCSEELIDYMHCVDHCVSKKLFNYLK